MQLINNHQVRFSDILTQKIKPGAHIMLCASYFSPNAIANLIPILNEAASIRIILDDPFGTDFRLAYDAAEWKQYYSLQANYRAALACDILRHKAEIRYNRLGGQKFLLVQNLDSIEAFSIVPNNLNLATLGLQPAEEPVFITAFNDHEKQYLNLFNQFWNNSQKDIKIQVLETMERAALPLLPDQIYKATLYQIFQNSTIDEASEQRLKSIGFKNTIIWGMLYNFQQDAVMGAIDKIETFGGCIIADSVGLGKTFEALAVMKYYQLRNDRILVLCPKKLRDNWMVYAQNDVRNILAKDRFNFDVLNHTDLSRKNGLSGDINLETINWGNYDLLVIDESHNFRNNPPKRDTVTRYQRLMNDIIKTGVKTKVLMLSATPVNTRMNDIKNQIAFITEQNDKGLEAFGIPSIEQTLRKAQQKFNHWLASSHGYEFSRDSLIASLDGAYFKILDLLTIARSRRHIQKYYDTSAIGKFPERLPPINKYAAFDTNGTFPGIDRVNNGLNALNLKFYSPLSYVRPDKKEAYEEKYDMTTSSGSIFKQIERETSLIHLMRVNLLKRLESSVHAFQLTLEALQKYIDHLMERIANANSHELFDNELDINDVDMDDPLLEDLLVGGKIKVLLQDMDLIKCREELLDDKKRITNLLAQTRVIDVNRDAKLFELKTLIKGKVSQPINAGNHKIIVFSAFADTVHYLYANLSAWCANELKLHAAQVTGGDTNKTTLPGSRTDLISILTNFSPVSKRRDIVMPEATDQIDILFCTDCISEGQNLQDCDYLINYDIHWNPVRIIQRFGRIDRIGSKNEAIQLVNFFPNLDLDQYIDLIARVKGRMQILDVSATGDDNIIEDGGIQNDDLEYRRRQLKSLQKRVPDLEDIEGSISITDLTFNDFKIDADRLSNAEREALATLPKGNFSVVASNLEDAPQGMIACLKDLAQTDEHGVSNNAIYPYVLCYINMEGQIFIPANNPKKCLDYFKKLCLGQTELLTPLLEAFRKETKQYLRMEQYAALLQNLIAHIKGVELDAGLDRLAVAGGTQQGKKGVPDSLELISYLLIR